MPDNRYQVKPSQAHHAARLRQWAALFPLTAGSTLVAIALGILLVVIIHPGRNAPFKDLHDSSDCGEQHAAQSTKGDAAGACW